MFHGSITALITPFTGGARSSRIDWDAFDRLIEWQIAEGTHGLVVCGTTGESPTLTPEEHALIVERAVERVKGRIPVIAGTGSNATAKTVALTRQAREARADAALVVTPYYNKPTQEGLYAHYKTVAEEVDIPILIYNIPGRSVVDLKTEIMARLAEIPNIIGVKDATGDLKRPLEVSRQIGPDFCQLSGEDGTVYEFLEAGGRGCISVTSNIAPALCANLHDAWERGDRVEAKRIADLLLPLHNAMFTETSPAPVKYAASRMGLCTDEVRLPLVAASQAARRAVDEAMDKAGIELQKAA